MKRPQQSLLKLIKGAALEARKPYQPGLEKNRGGRPRKPKQDTPALPVRPRPATPTLNPNRERRLDFRRKGEQGEKLSNRKAAVLHPKQFLHEDPYDYWWPYPENGQSVAIAGRLDIDTRNIISALIADHVGPWSDMSDFVRCAVGLYTQAVQERVKDKRFLTAMQVVNIRTLKLRMEKKGQDLDKYLDMTLDTAQAAKDAGHPNIARKVIRETLQSLTVIDDPDWKYLARNWQTDPRVKAVMGRSKHKKPKEGWKNNGYR